MEKKYLMKSSTLDIYYLFDPVVGQTLRKLHYFEINIINTKDSIIFTSTYAITSGNTYVYSEIVKGGL